MRAGAGATAKASGIGIRLARDAAGSADATLRMLEVAAADLAGAMDVAGVLPNHERPRDPLDARDPEYIHRTLPALRMWSHYYFRGEVSGLDRIPHEGPVLLVGNHSGGTLIADTFVFAQSFYDHFGPDRRFHQLAHDLVFRVPAIRALVERWGTIPASPANMGRALQRGAALLVYPGGDEETYRPSWQSDQIDFAGRTGFVKLALEHRARIVPVVAIGGQETALFLGRGRGLATALHLDRLMRLKVLPPVLGPPVGFTVMDLPIRFPLPAKIRIQVLPEIDLHQRLGPNPSVEDSYRLVTGNMQRSLTRMAKQRTVPVLG